MPDSAHRSPLPGHTGRAAVAIVAVGALAPSGLAPVAAPVARAEFSVGAVVLARAAITRAAIPDGFDVSAEDASRGFVDVPDMARLTIANTSPAGFALIVLPRSRVLSAVDVRGVGGQVSLEASGGEIVERGSRGTDIHLSLGFRFVLNPIAAPGRYAWPVTLAVRPLTE